MDNVKNAFYNTLKTVSTVVFPLITIPYISRVLMVEYVGRINFANSIVGYFTLIASLGVPTYAMRECSKVKNDIGRLERIASEIFSINLIAMILSYITLYVLVFFSDKINQYCLLILILSINIFGSIIGTEWLNMAVGDFKYITFRTVIFQMISLIMMFLFVKDKSDYLIYAFILVLSNSGAQIANIFYRKRYCKITFMINLNFKRHFKSIFLMFSLLLAQTLLANIDITVLGFIRTDSEVGLYSMAVKIYATIERVISSIAYVLIPEITFLYADKNFDEINGLLNTVLNFIITFSFPMVTGMAMLSKEIMVLVCGEEYAAAATSLLILAFAMLINLLGGSFFGNLILLPEGREGQFMAACCTSAVFNLISNCLVIPKWGMNGAAITTVASVSIVFLLCALPMDKQIKLNIERKQFVPVLLGSLSVCLICAAIKYIFSNMILVIGLSIVISTAVYMCILIVSQNKIVVTFLKKYLLK